MNVIRYFGTTVGTRFNGSEGTWKFWLLNPDVVKSNYEFLLFIFYYLYFFIVIHFNYIRIKSKLS